MNHRRKRHFLKQQNLSGGVSEAYTSLTTMLVPTLLLAMVFLSSSVCEADTTLYQNMTVANGQVVGSVIGQVGSSQLVGWTPDAGPPYQIYFVTADDQAGVSVSASGLVTVAGPINRQQKSSYQFLALSAKSINIVVSV